MTGLGTIVNVIAVLAGSLMGLLTKGKLPQRFQDIIMKALGLAVMFIGISGTLSKMFVIEEGGISTQHLMLIILCLAIGSVIGELIDIEKRLESVGEVLKRKLKTNKGNDQFVEGFVSASLLFCIGAMAIVGSLNDGISHDYTVLFSKSIIDGISAIVIASAMGIGTIFSAIAVGIYQGVITALASIISPYMTDQLIAQMSVVGSILIFGIGINMIFGKKIKVGNMLPAIFLPIIYNLFV